MVQARRVAAPARGRRVLPRLIESGARDRRIAAVALIALVLVGGAVVVSDLEGRLPPLPSFHAQACALEPDWWERTRRGYRAGRSGDIAILPRTPAYFGSGSGGWGHSGPWDYLQRVPLVFYGPGFVDAGVTVDEPATLADIAPTVAALLKGSFQTRDGRVLVEASRLSGRALRRPAPRLVVVVVWDGGGWNVLERWPDAWPHLRKLMEGGVSFTSATVGSSPSVTPAVHTTLGTGMFPWTHGITGIPVRDEDGDVVDAFMDGDSSRLIDVPTLAERWDELNDNRALVGMIGYEPWHLGMIGKGAEAPDGDRDDAVWLDTETNEWITNPVHYRLPDAIRDTGGLEQDLQELDAADGELDRSWGDEAILDDRSRIEETPAFIRYHTRAMMGLVHDEGYGADTVTDLVFTNYKQIDRVGHYFNMASEQVRQSLEETDRQLGNFVDFLDREVGRRRWVLVLTADHGQQPDEEEIGGYGIDPGEVVRDIDRRFGKITDRVPGTEVFLRRGALEDAGVSVEEVARFLGDYRLQDNAWRPDDFIAGSGTFSPGDRLFEMAIPSRLVPEIDCGEPTAAAAQRSG